MATDLKQHGINISLSSIGAIIPILVFLWIFVQPALVNSIAADLDDKISAQVTEKQVPLNNAFKAILQSDINKLKKQIAQLEFKESHSPDEWTSDDADELASTKIQLQALEEAKEEL